MARTWYDRRCRYVRDLPCGDLRVLLAVDIRRVTRGVYGGVKQERVAWLADNPDYTRRFARYVGKQCRGATAQGGHSNRWGNLRWPPGPTPRHD